MAKNAKLRIEAARNKLRPRHVPFLHWLKVDDKKCERGGDTSTISYHTYIVFCNSGRLAKCPKCIQCECVAMDEHLEIEADTGKSALCEGYKRFKH